MVADIKGFLAFQLLLLQARLPKTRQGFGPGVQDWGYVTVEPGAHMFWWLFYANPYLNSTPTHFNVYDKPLVIWLQGGPGGSSTGIGNFEEIGPIDIHGNLRNYTWVKDYNVLFIDNPVGTGFSYVEDHSLLARNNEQIAVHLLQFIKGFLKKLPAFRHVDTYILSQSYGGKMAAEFAYAWHSAEKAGSITSKLKGVGLGDPWISPLDTVSSWPSFLFNVGAVDRDGKRLVEKAVHRVREAVDAGYWENVTELFFQTQDLIDDLTAKIDPYNILKKISIHEEIPVLTLTHHMRQNVTPRLNTSFPIAVWGSQTPHVFDHLAADFMKDVKHIVKQLIVETSLEVFVYNGVLDHIVAVPGTVTWVDELFKSDKWRMTERKPVVVNGIVEGYSKELANFKLYWINRAGHNVPRENPVAMKAVLDHMMKKKL